MPTTFFVCVLMLILLNISFHFVYFNGIFVCAVLLARTWFVQCFICLLHYLIGSLVLQIDIMSWFMSLLFVVFSSSYPINVYTFKLSRYFSDWSAIKRRIERESWHWMPAWCGHICFANNKSSLSFAESESDYRVHHITISLWNVIHFYLTIRVTSYTQWLFIFSAHANHSSHFNLIQSKVQFAIAMNLNWGWTYTHTQKVVKEGFISHWVGD